VCYLLFVYFSVKVIYFGLNSIILVLPRLRKLFHVYNDLSNHVLGTFGKIWIQSLWLGLLAPYQVLYLYDWWTFILQLYIFKVASESISLEWWVICICISLFFYLKVATKNYPLCESTFYFQYYYYPGIKLVLKLWICIYNCWYTTSRDSSTFVI